MQNPIYIYQFEIFAIKAAGGGGGGGGEVTVFFKEYRPSWKL